MVISGAGPAGLIRAIQAISNGNPTRIIEKRSETAKGRTNIVALTEKTIVMLKYLGGYPYLIENNLIYPPNKDGYISVRLTDLEKSLKIILHRLKPELKIEYSSTIKQIVPAQDKISLITESSDQQTTISDVDILMNAEGARSSTNMLLGIGRTEVLPTTPVIAAMCRDDRPDITGLSSLFVYGGKSIAQMAITVYYHTIFFFKYLFSSDFRKQITGALILPTPGQNYVGCGFSDEINNRLHELNKNSNNQEYVAFASYWINLAICAANMVSFLTWFEGTYYHSGRHLPIAEFEIVHIGADCATKNSLEVNKSKVLLAGDASATVDPTTGLGCNTAIQSSMDFLEFLWDFNVAPQRIIERCEFKSEHRISTIHEESRQMRSQYRPDRLVPTMMMFRPTPLNEGRNQTINPNQNSSPLIN